MTLINLYWLDTKQKTGERILLLSFHSKRKLYRKTYWGKRNQNVNITMGMRFCLWQSLLIRHFYYKSRKLQQGFQKFAKIEYDLPDTSKNLVRSLNRSSITFLHTHIEIKYENVIHMLSFRGWYPIIRNTFP